jgi:hypothetical protein
MWHHLWLDTPGRTTGLIFLSKCAMIEIHSFLAFGIVQLARLGAFNVFCLKVLYLILLWLPLLLQILLVAHSSVVRAKLSESDSSVR